MKKRILGVIIAAFVLLTLITGCAANSSNTSNTIDVQVAAVQKKNIDAELNISGILVPQKTVNVYSKLSGQVEKVNVEVGSEVKEKDLLAVIETNALNLQLEQLQASLNSAKASEELAKGQVAQAKINLDSIQRAYEETKNLYDKGIASKAQLNEIETKYEIAKKQYETALNGTLNQAKAAVSAAQANIKNIKLQISNAKITSPINGVVTNKNINAGELAAPTAPIFTIADVSTLKLKGTISQRYLPYIKINQTIDVVIDVYPNKTYEGVITNIGPMAVGTGMYFPIEISIKNTDNLKPGLSAYGKIKINSRDGIVVPASAVVKNDGKAYVYVVENNTVKKRFVEIGVSNDKEVEIVSGLNENEKVAISNVNALFDNAVVNVK
ncbi:MAG: efflux RND transporter periplasmic adaptor subunit [Caloramator sp.]|nr:efflux RND transporter periplasmic adaptor subunit [Caloramator sp.]